MVDISGFIEGVVDGVGLGIWFLKYFEWCCIFLYVVDLFFVDESDLVENVKVIIEEFEKYSLKLVEKFWWLVFNKVDLLLEDEVEECIKYVVEIFNWEGLMY